MSIYLTIWVALVLFVAAEAGKGPLSRHGTPAPWARPLWIAGGVLAVVHMLLTFALRYQWDHETAVVETARQGAAVYGFAWRGSIYVNYLFLVLWLTVAWRWRHWLWRAFALMMIVNGAVIFARPAVRPFGVALTASLLWVWIAGSRTVERQGLKPSGPQDLRF